MCYSAAVGSKFVGHLHSKNLAEPSHNILLSSLDGSPLLAILLFAFHSKYIQEEIHADLVLLRFSMRFIKSAFELLHFYLRFFMSCLKVSHVPTQWGIASEVYSPKKNPANWNNSFIEC